MNQTTPAPQPTIDLAPDDPRRPFAAAVRTAGMVLGGLTDGQLAAATPCADWDAETVARHQVAILRRVAAVGRGDDWQTTPDLATDAAASELHQAWTDAAHDVQSVFSDDSLLDAPLSLPFGTVPGAVALAVYTAEFTIHAWDLAAATDQSPEWDQSAVEVGLEAVRMGVPAEGRGPEMPFDPVVELADDAPAIDKMVAWMGRDPR